MNRWFRYRFFIALLPVTCFLFPGCIHTSRVAENYNYGTQLKGTDVVLFSGFEQKDSKISKWMLEDTEKMLINYGIKTVYLYDPELDYEMTRAGLMTTERNLDNDDFIYKMREVFGITHIFLVGSVSEYQGEMIKVSEATALDDETGIIFEVYDLAAEKMTTAMRLTGSTLHFVSINEEENRTYGNIYKNYRKGLKKLMKASTYN